MQSWAFPGLLKTKSAVPGPSAGGREGWNLPLTAPLGVTSRRRCHATLYLAALCTVIYNSVFKENEPQVFSQGPLGISPYDSLMEKFI